MAKKRTQRSKKQEEEREPLPDEDREDSEACKDEKFCLEMLPYSWIS